MTLTGGTMNTKPATDGASLARGGEGSSLEPLSLRSSYHI